MARVTGSYPVCRGFESPSRYHDAALILQRIRAVVLTEPSVTLAAYHAVGESASESNTSPGLRIKREGRGILCTEGYLRCGLYSFQGSDTPPSRK